MTPEELQELFKDSIGRWRTASLFEETCDDPAKYPPIYTLNGGDTSSCVSLKDKYLELADTTEYVFAKMYLGGYDHWKRICESYVLKPYIADWRLELDKRLQANYLTQLREIAAGTGNAALSATKYLLETQTSFGKNGTAKRGRPSKEEVAGNLKEETRTAKELAEDAARLGIKVVK